MANVALAYDLDNTLIRGNHPSIILEARGVDVALFWKKVTTAQREAEEGGVDAPLDIAYLAFFMHEVRHGKLQGLTVDEMRGLGKHLEQLLYPGLPSFFGEIKAAHPYHTISHNV